MNRPLARPSGTLSPSEGERESTSGMVVEERPSPRSPSPEMARRTPEASAAGIRARRCYAAFARFTGSSPSSAALISRIRNFWIFPVTVVGNSVTNFT